MTVGKHQLQICMISWVGSSVQPENMNSKPVQAAKHPQNQNKDYNQKTYADYYQFWVPGEKKGLAHYSQHLKVRN